MPNAIAAIFADRIIIVVRKVGEVKRFGGSEVARGWGKRIYRKGTKGAKGEAEGFYHGIHASLPQAPLAGRENTDERRRKIHHTPLRGLRHGGSETESAEIHANQGFV